MRIKILALGFPAFIVAGAMAATPAQKPARPAAASTPPASTAIPADVRARVVAKLPGASPADVAGVAHSRAV